MIAILKLFENTNQIRLKLFDRELFKLDDVTKVTSIVVKKLQRFLKAISQQIY